MKNAAQMFKFTQLRPVNGIEINKIRKKHIPLYKKDYATSLLSSVRKLGLPSGLAILNKHIQTSQFNARINDFNEMSSFEKNSDLTQTSMIILVLQKSISFSQTFPTLNDKNNENLKHILQETRTIKNKFNINLETLKKEISKLTQKDKDNIVDDCYALLLQSAYYPEYRRYIETLYRFIYMSDTYNIETLFKILFPNDTNLDIDEFAILRQLLKGRILLPQNVETTSKPLPLFKERDENDNNTPIEEVEVIKDLEVIKGASYTIQKLKQNIVKVNTTKTPTKKK